MAASWYYASGNRQMGPVPESEFDALVASGAIREETLVWHEGLANWTAYGNVRLAVPPVPVAPGAADESPRRFCTNCGRPTAEQELATFGDRLICATCKPMFVHQLRERGLHSPGLLYAGFWVRFVARLIDAILLYMVFLPLTFILLGSSVFTNDPSAGFSPMFWLVQGILLLFQLVFAAAYETWFLVHYAATPGKMVLGKKVIVADGSPMTVGRALGRYFATYISSFTLGIGYIMAAFDSEKRALHDRICDTRVVAK